MTDKGFKRKVKVGQIKIILFPIRFRRGPRENGYTTRRSDLGELVDDIPDGDGKEKRERLNGSAI